MSTLLLSSNHLQQSDRRPLPYFISDKDKALVLPLPMKGTWFYHQTFHLLSTGIGRRTGYAVANDEQACIEATTSSTFP